MSKKKPNRSFQAPDNCSYCNRTTMHSVEGWQETNKTVTNTRNCNTCGTRGNYYSPLNMFKLFAAGAIAASLFYFVNPLNLF